MAGTKAIDGYNELMKPKKKKKIMRWISIHRERISSNRKKYFCRRYYYCSGCDFAVGKLVFKKNPR